MPDVLEVLRPGREAFEQQLRLITTSDRRAQTLSQLMSVAPYGP